MPPCGDCTEVSSAKLEGRCDSGLLVGVAGAGQVEVQPVRTDLLSLAQDEPQADLGVVPRQQRTARFVDDFPPEDTTPEARQTSRVVRIEGHSQQTAGHLPHLGDARAHPHVLYRGAATRPRAAPLDASKWR